MGRMVFHSLSECAHCGATGDDFSSPSVEAWEVLGELVCEDCAGDAIAEAAENEEVA